MSYAGDVTPAEAWSVLEQDRRAVLIDVRTMPEWTFVGVPELTGIGKELVRLSWQIFPDMGIDQQFTEKLQATGLAPDAPLYFICRSGGRSAAAAAAMTAAGFTACYNVAGGFEGDLDGRRHRGSVNGWKKSDLPWVQG